VVWGAKLPDQRYCTVGGDNHLGGALATRHLLEIGRQQIAIIGDWSTPEGRLRYEGYHQTLMNTGLAPNPVLEVALGVGRDSHREAAQRLIASGHKFDGLFCLSDAIAMAAINSLTEHGLRVPTDVAVVGYDDISLARFYTPSITTIRQDREQGGRLMVEKLLAMIDGERVDSGFLPTDIIVRNSTLS
jgi:DNA-binding LacI/PurR family transcriptional regulator